MILRTWTLLVPAALLAIDGAEAQNWTQSDERWCDEWPGSARACHVLTAELADYGSIRVDGGQNGGVTVEGWSRNAVEVRAKVWARASTEERAAQLAADVRVDDDGGELVAVGPGGDLSGSWGVSWEIYVPEDTDLDLATHNGGISISGVRGDIRFDALNGGVHLSGLAGDVSGRTTNGGVHVELEGDRWDGDGLDVATTNGGVTVRVPEGYSADFKTRTVNGGLAVGFPITVRGRIDRSLDVELGSGGPTVRAVTTNGDVRIVRTSP